MVKHHLPDEFLMAYSAGILPEAFSLVVASHVSLSDDSRSRLEAYDAVGGAVLDNATPCAVADDALSATLAMISGSGTQKVVRRKPSSSLFPQPLRDYVGEDLNDVQWRPIGMGVKQCFIPTEGEATVRLLSIPSGTAMPDHGHGGTEMTLVLQGAFEDETGKFGRGDVEVADEDLHHTPVAVGDQDCICLAAADARLKFTSILPRLAQPFIRI